MIGKSPLWVSKQHGHRPETMFRAYAAWTEGAPESEVAVIRAAMGLEDQPQSIKRSRRTGAVVRVGTKIGTSARKSEAKSLKDRELIGGKGGTRTLDLGIMSATL
jgi:hypothetical protein